MRGIFKLDIGRDRTLRQVDLIRILLPLLLFVVVAVFEIQEHWVQTGKIEFTMASEILFFGVMGPLAVFFVLTYFKYLFQEVISARE
jgi:hypothetical protein